ncbi:Clp protease N-terminal domain-containing protein [Microbulbifer sp. CNSA002]|uniref:Clp protease N-terminal domain-containing protein n=1 Tax=Microbulbifer sp. CNSA002 TaxID=3373604 RepID=UPI0039B694F3
MLSKDLETSLNTAFTYARSKHHEFFTVEHLLLSLFDSESANDVFQEYKIDTSKLKSQVIDFVDSSTPLISDKDTTTETQPTLGFQRVLQRAVFYVQSEKKIEVTGADILAAILSEQESLSAKFLSDYRLTRNDVINFINHDTSFIDNEKEIEKAFNESYDESFDYKSLLKEKDKEIHVIKNELDLVRENHKTELANFIDKTKETLRKSQEKIEKLEEEITNLLTNKTSNKISTSINFKPEHKQAGLGILSYFSEVIHQKYPDKNVSISITQEANTVSLVIITEEGDQEIIKRALDQYGKVAAGIIPTKDFLSDPIHIAQLETKLDIAHTEIRSLERILGIQENTIATLKEALSLISVAHGESQKNLCNALEKISAPRDFESAFNLIDSLSSKAILTNDEISFVKEAVESISSQHPDRVDELKNYCVNVSSGMLATTILETLKMLGL